MVFPSPFRGSYFSMIEMSKLNLKAVKEFPSPFRGSYFSIRLINWYIFSNLMFPSPSRGSYFSMWKILILQSQWNSVSVPFTGILFLNLVIILTDYSKVYNVSVPFTGFLFLNNLMIVRTTNGISCFRPLSGDLISQCVVRGWKYELAEVSVPFPGILFLNDSKWVFDESTTVWFPSPSRGSYFSISF